MVSKLCYSVDEADRRSGFNVAFALSVRANGQNISGDQSFDIAVGRNVQRTQEVSANVDGDSEVDLVCVLGVAIGNDNVQGNHFCEIVHDNPCEYLLDNALPTLGMEVGEANGVFKLPERSLDTPSHFVERPKLVRREVGLAQVCDDCLVRAVGDHKPDNAESNGVKKV